MVLLGSKSLHSLHGVNTVCTGVPPDVVPPYPYSIEEDHDDVDLENYWAALPQLFISCHLRPKGRRMPKTGCNKIGLDDVRHQVQYHLVLFSTFAVLKLPIQGPMEDAGVVKLYEPSPTQCLYLAAAENMVGRFPLIPCFLDGKARQCE